MPLDSQHSPEPYRVRGHRKSWYTAEIIALGIQWNQLGSGPSSLAPQWSCDPEVTQRVSVRRRAALRTQNTEGAQMIPPKPQWPVPPGPFAPQGQLSAGDASTRTVLQHVLVSPAGHSEETITADLPCGSLGRSTRYNVNKHTWIRRKHALNFPTTHLDLIQMEVHEDANTVHS